MRSVFLPLLLPFVLAPPAQAELGAEEVLKALAAKNESIRTMRARYVQQRTTELSAKPLESSGVLHYSRAQGCLVLHGEKPRRVILRLDRTTYQVYRPQRKRAERFVFRGGFSGSALVKLFSPEVGKLSTSYDVISFQADETLATVTLRPRSKQLRKRLRTLAVTVRLKDMVMVRFAYSSREKESVRIDLQRIERNPDLAPGLFASKLPVGTDLQISEIKE